MVGTMWLWVTRCRSISSSIASGRPPVHQHDRVAEVQRRRREASTAVWYSGDPQMCTLPPCASVPNRRMRKPAGAGGRVGVGAGEPAAHALRLAGGARRVVHGGAGRALLGPIGGLTRDEVGKRSEAGHVTDGEASLRGERDLRRRLGARVAVALVTDEGTGLAVVHDVGDLGPDEVVVDRREVPAGLHGREVQGEQLDAVGQHRGHTVARREAQRPAARGRGGCAPPRARRR